MTDKERDFLHALVISAACASLPVRKKTPIAYSYNGVVLPKLPEWDRDAYPYAVIFQTKTSGTTYCVATSEPLIIAEMYCQGGASSGAAKLRTQINENFLWNDFAEDANAVLGTSYMTFLWSNYDVYNSSGVLKLEASEPISIYE